MTRLECVAGIQARMGSRRFPGKVLADLCGKPLIERVFERTRAASQVGATYVLTSDDPSDDPLVEFLEASGIPYRRGSLPDVRSRYLALADELQPRYVVRITGDCPFVEPEFIDLRVRTLRANDGDVAPVGNDPRDEVEGVLGSHDVYSARGLRLSLESDDPRDREHVASFFFAGDPRLKRVRIRVPEPYKRAGLRLCVDEPADIELARAVWAAVDREGDGLFPLRRVLRWIDAHPAACELNRHVQPSADNRDLLRERRARA